MIPPWNETFSSLYTRCLAEYVRGNTDFNSYYSPANLAFLTSIGCQPREFFDFIEDHGPELPLTTALLVAALRRSFFLTEQERKPSSRVLTADQLPLREAQLEGIAWLPRIIDKAKAKLRGELHPDLMYGCGGDRNFISKHGLHLADFLETVRRAGDDIAPVLDYVRGILEASTC